MIEETYGVPMHEDDIFGLTVRDLTISRRKPRRGSEVDAVELGVAAPPFLYSRRRRAERLPALVPANGGLQGDGGPLSKVVVDDPGGKGGAVQGRWERRASLGHKGFKS